MLMLASQPDQQEQEADCVQGATAHPRCTQQHLTKTCHQRGDGPACQACTPAAEPTLHGVTPAHNPRPLSAVQRVLLPAAVSKWRTTLVTSC